MKTTIIFLAVTLGLGSLAPARATSATDSTADGWVRHADRQQLTVCYHDMSPPPVGTVLSVLRTSYITSGKGVPRPQFTPTGLATVIALDGASCDRAKYSGSAGFADHARVVDTITQAAAR